MRAASASLRSEATDPATAVEEMLRQLGGFAPRVLIFFHSIDFDGVAFASLITKRLSTTEIIGCSTCGQFTDAGPTRSGVSALALGGDVVRSCKSAMARFHEGVKPGAMSAVNALAEAAGKKLRDLDGSRYVGIVLIGSTKGRDEAVNAALGDAAPFLSFAGGTAGDDTAFEKVWCHVGGESSDDGAALLLLELEHPCVILKTCNYVPSDTSFIITKADPSNRMILELDGRPALAAYAEAIGHDPALLGMTQFLFNPLGLVIEGKPWLRCVFGVSAERDAVVTGCEVLEGMEVYLMRNEDILERTRHDLASSQRVAETVPNAALMFNCVYRRLEVEALGVEAEYHEILSGFPLAGCHTHGESWLGHINQTLVGVLFR